MSSLFGVLLFVIALMLAIFFHEGGHYLTAKLFGMKVERFFLGFGRTVWSFRRGETEYGVKALPLGGFCKIAGMTPHEHDGGFLEEERPGPGTPPPEPCPPERQFRNKPAWQRAIVLSAGSITHLVVAFVLLYLIIVATGYPLVSTQIHQVVDRTSTGAVAPARQAGLQVGDRIVAVDGRRVGDFEQLRSALTGKAGRSAKLTVDRGGQQRTIDVTLAYDPESGKSHGFLGVVGTPVGTRRPNPIAALGDTSSDYAALVTGSVRALGHFPSLVAERLRPTPAATPSSGGDGSGDGGGAVGLIGAARLAGEAVAAQKWLQFIALIVEFNVFIGLVNMIPIPPMDGGYLGFLLYEKLARRRFDLRKAVPFAAAVVGVLLVLTIGLAVLDIFSPIANPYGK